MTLHRHCEERSDEAIQTLDALHAAPGLLRFARNDETRGRCHETAPVRLRPARHGRRSARIARRIRRRRAHLGRRPVAHSDAQSAADRGQRADRHFAASRARRHRRPRRHDRDRRRGDAEHADELAAAQTKAAAASRGAAVRRSLPDPQPGYRLRLHRPCRSEFGAAAVARGAGWFRGAALPQRRRARRRRRGVSAGHAHHRARRRGIDRRPCGFRSSRARASPSRRSRAAMATLP